MSRKSFGKRRELHGELSPFYTVSFMSQPLSIYHCKNTPLRQCHIQHLLARYGQVKYMDLRGCRTTISFEIIQLLMKEFDMSAIAFSSASWSRATRSKLPRHLASCQNCYVMDCQARTQSHQLSEQQRMFAYVQQLQANSISTASVHTFSGIVDADLLHMINCSDLEVLWLTGCSRVTHRGIIILVRHLPKLRIIGLPRQRKCNAQMPFIRNLWTSCPTLQYVHCGISQFKRPSTALSAAAAAAAPITAADDDAGTAGAVQRIPSTKQEATVAASLTCPGAAGPLLSLVVNESTTPTPHADEDRRTAVNALDQGFLAPSRDASGKEEPARVDAIGSLEVVLVQGVHASVEETSNSQQYQSNVHVDEFQSWECFSWTDRVVPPPAPTLDPQPSVHCQQLTELTLPPAAGSHSYSPTTRLSLSSLDDDTRLSASSPELSTITFDDCHSAPQKSVFLPAMSAATLPASADMTVLHPLDHAIDDGLLHSDSLLELSSADDLADVAPYAIDDHPLCPLGDMVVVGGSYADVAPVLFRDDRESVLSEWRWRRQPASSPSVHRTHCTHEGNDMQLHLSASDTDDLSDGWQVL